MSRKTLWVLVVVWAVLAGAMWMKGQRSSSPAGENAAAGGALLPSVDLNTIQAITIDDGSATTRLAQVDGAWRVAEQDNYPADVNRLREMIRAINGTENAQMAEKGAAHLAEFGLAADGESAPVRISLEHDKGTTVLSLGKNRESRGNEEVWMPAGGRYVRVDEGPVLLIKDDIVLAEADPDQWWDRLLLEVAPETIRKVEVGSGNGSFAIERGTNGAFALVGGSGEETVEVPAATRLFGALRRLQAEQILPLGEPEAFTNTLTCRFEAEGVTYSIQLGEAQSDENGGRPMKIEVMAAADATPEQQSAAAAAEKRLNNRMFLIPAYLAEPLSQKKDALIKKAEVVPEPPPVPAEAPPAES